MKHLFTLFIMSIASVLTTSAQKDVLYSVENNMPLFYQQLKEQLTYPWAWQNKQSSMQFNEWREKARREIIEKTMQIAPPAPESFDYEVIATEKREGYEAQKILFNISKWEKTLAYLLVPDMPQKNVKSKKANKKAAPVETKKFPALLMLHDHGAHFAIGKEKMVRPFDVDSVIIKDAEQWIAACYDSIYVGDELAKAGYVVLSIDALFWGDRSRKEDRTDIAKALSTKERKQKTYDTQQALSSNLLQMGTSWGAWITWDDMRAADFLANLPMVDRQNVGCVGFSMGSYRSWMLAAMSDAVKAAANICWMNDTEHLMNLTNNQNKGGSAYSMLIPGIRNLMDYPHVASLACPKPMLFFNGYNDKLFPVPGVESAYRTMREVWQSQNADDKLTTKLWQEKHFFNREMQQEVRLFFDKNLK